MGPPKMRFLDTYKREGTKKRFSNRTNILYYGSFHYGNWQEAPKRLKMEKKGRLANDICHYRLVSSWSPNFTLKR